MPTAGLPVASTMTSMPPALAFAASAVNAVAASLAASQPTVLHASFARCGSRSTMTGTSSPGTCGTWDRNIEPNLPAPISATRTGLPAARRALRREKRFMWVLPVIPGRSGTLRTRNPEVGERDSGFSPAGCPGMTVKKLLRRFAMRAGEPQQRIVVHGLDRCEIAMGDVVGPCRLANVVRDRVQRQIDDL